MLLSVQCVVSHHHLPFEHSQLDVLLLHCSRLPLSLLEHIPVCIIVCCVSPISVTLYPLCQRVILSASGESFSKTPQKWFGDI